MSSRLKAVDPAQATGKAKALLDGVQAKLGITPNMMRTMAQSPAVLEGYLNFSGALGHGLLDAHLREEIALAVGETDGCEYCVSAHTTLGKLAGLKEDEILSARQGTAGDEKAAAVLKFARAVVEKRGAVADQDVAAVRQAGLGDGEIAEVIAHVALNIFTNYFNVVAQTEIDFPRIKPLASKSQSA